MNTANAALAGRLRKWLVPRYHRYILFYTFENGVVHLIDVVDGKTNYDIENQP